VCGCGCAGVGVGHSRLGRGTAPLCGGQSAPRAARLASGPLSPGSGDAAPAGPPAPPQIGPAACFVTATHPPRQGVASAGHPGPPVGRGRLCVHGSRAEPAGPPFPVAEARASASRLARRVGSLAEPGGPAVPRTGLGLARPAALTTPSAQPGRERGDRRLAPRPARAAAGPQPVRASRVFAPRPKAGFRRNFLAAGGPAAPGPPLLLSPALTPGRPSRAGPGTAMRGRSTGSVARIPVTGPSLDPCECPFWDPSLLQRRARASAERALVLHPHATT
jgi:hypothetical protein